MGILWFEQKLLVGFLLQRQCASQRMHAHMCTKDDGRRFLVASLKQPVGLSWKELNCLLAFWSFIFPA